ncbi:hypothetical protein QYM36_009296 [Artemia franciscana]|uniref:Ribosomal protein L2 C-terminal domain-containing protein n=1 Tax=Artemia franciscana TaxID=6661 RepID=A0AA88HTC0_ARTSF|nr:hypothetical protein QYM36_009296 [Artemia franciscana]
MSEALTRMYKIHFPEDGQYTIEPLRVTKLAGRDPLTGRVVHGKIGGGIKMKHLWVDIHRTAPKEGPPLVERVMSIQRDLTRNAFVALTISGDKVRYRYATTSMKPGDLITTYGDIPRIPVRPKEGDAHPLGALPIGTKVCCIENLPGNGARFAIHAGVTATITRKISGRVCFTLPNKQEFAVPQECMATVGQVSNPEYSSIPIGSAQANRLLGNRPSSGLWHRKTGIHGRKLRNPKKLKVTSVEPKPKTVVGLTLPGLPKIMVRPPIRSLVPV